MELKTKVRFNTPDCRFPFPLQNLGQCWSYGMLLVLLYNFTISYHITDTKPIPTAINSCKVVGLANPKKAVNAGIKSKQAVITTVIPMINGVEIDNVF